MPWLFWRGIRLLGIGATEGLTGDDLDSKPMLPERRSVLLALGTAVTFGVCGAVANCAG